MIYRGLFFQVGGFRHTSLFLPQRPLSLFTMSTKGYQLFMFFVLRLFDLCGKKKQKVPDHEK